MNNIVFLVDPKGAKLGIVSLEEAQKKAEEYNLDLICVNNKVNPPIFKIMDYQKYCFEIKKKTKNNSKSKTREKEIRITPQIDKNDLQTKFNAISKFLKKGNKVRLSMRFKGRQMTHVELGEQKMNDFIMSLKDIATVEKKIEMKNKTLSVLLSSKTKK